MRKTGIIRNLDSLGRVVVPKEWRKALGVKDGDPIEMIAEDGRVILQKPHTGCVICGSTDAKIVGLQGDKMVCRDCTAQIVKATKSERELVLVK